MPKAKDARADKAFEMYKQGLKLIDIANQLGDSRGNGTKVGKTGTKMEWRNECNVAKK